MLNRHVIFALCVMFSLVIHGALFYIAPHVTLFDTPAVPRPILQRYRIHLDSRPRTEIASRTERSPSDLASRPGSIRELLERDSARVSPVLPEPEVASIPDLTERIAEKELERGYALEEDSGMFDRIDARILEIAEETARNEVQVARRVVRPSPERLVPEGVLPVLRRQERPDEGVPLPLVEPPQPAASSAGDGEPVLAEMLPPEANRPPYEEGVVEPQVQPLEQTAPPIEEIVARAPIEREMRQVESERDFDALDDMLSFRLEAYAPPGQATGYFRLQIAPRSGQQIDPLPKDVTFVVDASKSIAQPKLNATIDGLGKAIAQLRPEDRFNVVVFRDSPLPFQPEPVAASAANKAAARSFVQRLQSGGETDVYQGIHPVIQQAPRPGAPGVVFVISDGRPTTGVRDGRTIINGLTADNDLRNSIFAFAGGQTVNRYLLDLLAYRNKGESHVVNGVSDIPSSLPEFFQRFQEPILIDLRADYGRIDESEVFPQVVPDFYKDRAVTIYGRYDRLNDSDFSMRLTGLAHGRTKELIFRTDLKDAATGDQSVARNWAFQKSYHIIGQMVTQGETAELKAELRRLELEYNIRTSYTE